MKRIYFLLAIIPALMTILMYSKAFALTTEADLHQHMRTLDEQRSVGTTSTAESSEPETWVEERSPFEKRTHSRCHGLYEGDNVGYQNCMYVHRRVRENITNQRWGLD